MRPLNHSPSAHSFSRTLVTALSLTSAAPIVAHAQVVPVGFSASVRVDSTYYRGDTLFIRHAVSNAPTSPQRLWGFALETPAPVAAQPTPPGDWLLMRETFDGHPAAIWMALGATEVRPGASAPPLLLGAIGVPDVVTYWVIADTPPKQTDDPDREPPEDPMVQRSIRGTTVGVVTIPEEATPAQLATRLRTLLARACGQLAWIAQQGICTSLDVKLAHAEEALATGDRQLAREELLALTHELDAQHGAQSGKHVGDAAYALLRPNLTFLLGRP